jgi:hypothetical protein
MVLRQVARSQVSVCDDPVRRSPPICCSWTCSVLTMVCTGRFWPKSTVSRATTKGQNKIWFRTEYGIYLVAALEHGPHWLRGPRYADDVDNAAA